MLFRITQYVGIAIIVLFCAYSISLATAGRELQSSYRNSFRYAYASFFEDRFFDMRMKLTIDKTKKDDRLVLAAIDDQSLTKIGRWPWTRTKHAAIVDKLNTFGAKVIAFDIFYSEPELACNSASPDDVLAASLKKFQEKPGNKIVLPYSLEDIINPEELENLKKIKTERERLISQNVAPEEAEKKFPRDPIEEHIFLEAPEQLFNFMLGGQQNASLQTYVVAKKVFPIPALANADFALSHIEADGDLDGVFRHYRVVANVDSTYQPSFALQIYKYFSGDAPKVEIPANVDDAKLITAKGAINLNYNGEAKIRWFGGTEFFPTVSILDILNAKDDNPEMHKTFNGKAVFLGSTAFGAHDFRNTPVDSQLPGIFFHMNMVNMLLEGRYFKPEEKSIIYSWTMLGVGTVIMILVMLFNNAILDLLVVNLIIGGMFYIDTFILIPKGYNVRLFFASFSVVMCYSWSTFLHFYQSNKEKKKIKGTFSRYLAPSIVNDLLKNPDKVKLGGEKKNITVFFSDVRDFTTISEKLTPEQLSTCLNKYMTMMTDTLFEHRGTLDKYIGDAMVAYWGAPVEFENHAYYAVKGAIQMIERLPPINEEFKRDGFPLFKHGIGLNTGDCSVGNMGSNQIFSYTALGDNMNLGARLESLCKFYGVQINISEYTKNAIPADMAKEFTFRTLDKVRVKGKENAVTIYEVLHPSHPLYNDRETLNKHEEAFELYLNQKFNEAEAIFHELHENYPEDKSFKRMYQICKDFGELPPPPGWDGTYTHKEK
jgi:adenylate cyclase